MSTNHSGGVAVSEKITSHGLNYLDFFEINYGKG